MLEVTRVRILRNPVPGEPAGQLVFIGDAVQVDGARPDVQAMFPTLPHASRAGWGYLLLTNVLPALGNGTFTLTAGWNTIALSRWTGSGYVVVADAVRARAPGA